MNWVVLGLFGYLATGGPVAMEEEGPRVAWAWPSGPMEVRIAFDRAIDAEALDGLLKEPIVFGEGLARGQLRIVATELVDGGRTVVLRTDPHPAAARYSLVLGGLRAAGTSGPGVRRELTYTLHGVEAEWWSEDGAAEGPSWAGTWPHLDPKVVREHARGAVEIERGLALLTRRGRLTYRSLIEVPAGQGSLRLQASGPFVEVAIANELLEVPEGARVVEAPIDSSGQPVDLLITVETGTDGEGLTLEVSHVSEKGPAPRALSLDALWLPWAPPPAALAGSKLPLPPVLLDGDPKRGEAVFFSEQARCSTCHRFRGKGTELGPDLTRPRAPDLASIYRDISDPSVVLHPDYVPFTVVLKDGQVLSGTVRAEGSDALRVVNTDAKVTIVARDEVIELRPSATSIMPVGLIGAIGEEGLRDLLAFLATGER